MSVDYAETRSWAAMDMLNLPSSLLVRAISVLCLALGTLMLLPVFFCVAYDLSLWMWRQWSNLFSSPQRHDVPAPLSRPSAASTSSDNGMPQSSRKR